MSCHSALRRRLNARMVSFSARYSSLLLPLPPSSPRTTSTRLQKTFPATSWSPPPFLCRALSSRNEVEERIRKYAKEACRVEELQGFEAKDVLSSAVIGAGTMGGGIAMCLAEKNIKVQLIDKDPKMLQGCFERMKKNWENAVSKGKITKEVLEQRLKCIHLHDSVDACRGVDLVIEAIFEDMKAKKEIFKEVDTVAKEDAILASNTSTLNIDHIFSDVSRPHNTVGLHFFSPAQVMPLLEVVRGGSSSKQTLATAMKLGQTLGKSPVLAGNCFGFIGNRMFESYTKEAMFLLEEGALPHEVDEAIQEWGMVMGPFAVSDLAGKCSWPIVAFSHGRMIAGLDIGYLIRKEQGLVDPQTRSKESGRYAGTIADRLVLSGRKGQKTQGGFYDYSKGRNPERDPSVEEIVKSVSRDLGVTRRKIQKEEIVERCILSLVNEGYKILDEGIARAWTDIDVVYAYGYGARNQQPMTYARELGMKKVLELIRKYQRQCPDAPHWKPAQGILDALREEDRLRAQQQNVPYLG
ncbi:hypothetical protein GUITHDRAFT_161810 [Guillardia theta CCMP2712]|uniref:3-hydroxyacyl-CoA dehydrogenase n=1 Tax=Guillardia theta (strain CCMP2712) TaxID=905079 RepID=L1JPV4_GUITC|nr:hypothetical protein GUITHDRAFT_161810 [Guillardia theta CCMP2712]EKX50492.1 hypothetical protein GUITHDRAFT_161810 [Guillardia theta CCMP2712]|eukprot:XP_005837472.1 hypothetical protein GUITHDRAFT_161810 [Guillardia theta CCMP2712]